MYSMFTFITSSVFLFKFFKPNNVIHCRIYITEVDCKLLAEWNCTYCHVQMTLHPVLTTTKTTTALKQPQLQECHKTLFRYNREQDKYGLTSYRMQEHTVTSVMILRMAMLYNTQVIY